MFVLSAAQTRRCLTLLVAFHILVIAASNYLVQLPFSLFGLHTTWALSAFPSSSLPPT
ncbi:inner membrane protein YhhQ [Halomonas elongata]|uniref:Inner membrane protein YhhQ n=1 Tax=Halomonas elongata TaxID=2746 RepID=A0A1B8P1Z9_HALEL|nr:inner membrane protein YhhQ [Halomonas elongata]